MKYRILIERDRGTGVWQEPAIIEPVVWETYRKETPSKLTFKVIKDATLGFNEGARVQFIVDGVNVFLGYVFEKQRDKDQLIQVTAYDQLRYLKNKNAYLFENTTASDFVKRICSDFLLKTGTIENSGYAIKQILYANDTLFDMIQGCVDETVMQTGNLYCLYDDFGKLNFRNIKNLKLNYVVKPDTAENFDYNTSIDSNTYNRIKIQKASEDKGLSDIVVKESTKNIRDWGVIQYFEQWGEDHNQAQVEEKAESLLKLYNSKSRTLGVKGCIGDIRVRAGFSVLVQLSLGDIPTLNNYMLVEEAKHTFEESNHKMDLTFRGNGEFYG